MHPAKEGFSALPFFDEFDLSTVDILLISQYVGQSLFCVPLVTLPTPSPLSKLGLFMAVDSIPHHISPWFPSMVAEFFSAVITIASAHVLRDTIQYMLVIHLGLCVVSLYPCLLTQSLLHYCNFTLARPSQSDSRLIDTLLTS